MNEVITIGVDSAGEPEGAKFLIGTLFILAALLPGYAQAQISQEEAIQQPTA